MSASADCLCYDGESYPGRYYPIAGAKISQSIADIAQEHNRRDGKDQRRAPSISAISRKRKLAFMPLFEGSMSVIGIYQQPCANGR